MMIMLQDGLSEWTLVNTVFNLRLPFCCYKQYNTCCLCSSLERKAPDMKRLSRPLRSSFRREVRRGRRASREASVILLPGRDKLSNLEPRHRPTWKRDNGGNHTGKEMSWWEFKHDGRCRVGRDETGHCCFIHYLLLPHHKNYTCTVCLMVIAPSNFLK